MGCRIDRICEIVENQNIETIVGIVPVGNEQTEICMKVARRIRESTDVLVKMKTEAKTVKQHLGYLKNLDPTLILFIGEEEAVNQTVKLKICSTAEHIFIPISQIFENPALVLSNYLKK